MPVEDSFPEPRIIPPVSGVHKHTIILLHGRGSNAATFAPSLLNTPIHKVPPKFDNLFRSDEGGESNSTHTNTVAGLPVVGLPAVSTPTTIAHLLPNAKFVFPTAPKQRATVYKRSIIRQWFDDWHLNPELSGDVVDHRYDEGLQTSGLGATVLYLHDLITQEAQLVGGPRNVVLGGISQGCAASLMAALLWNGEGLAAVVGMCGWLPYLHQLYNAAHGQSTDYGLSWKKDGERCKDPFARTASPRHDEAGVDSLQDGLLRIDFSTAEEPDTASSSTDEYESVVCLGETMTEKALEWLRGELELPKIGEGADESSATPVILCHGVEDEKVRLHEAEQSSIVLSILGIWPIQFQRYDDDGHEYSGEMLADIVGFLQTRSGGAWR